MKRIQLYNLEDLANIWCSEMKLSEWKNGWWLGISKIGSYSIVSVWDSTLSHVYKSINIFTL